MRSMIHVTHGRLEVGNVEWKSAVEVNLEWKSAVEVCSGSQFRIEVEDPSGPPYSSLNVCMCM